MKDYIKHFDRNEIQKEMRNFLVSIANNHDLNDNFGMKPEEFEKIIEELSISKEEKKKQENSNLKLSTTKNNELGSSLSSKRMDSSARKKKNQNKIYKDRFTEKYLSLNFPELQAYDIFKTNKFLSNNHLNESDFPAIYEKKTSEEKNIRTNKNEKIIIKKLSSSSENGKKYHLQSNKLELFLDGESEEDNLDVEKKVRKKLDYQIKDHEIDDKKEQISNLTTKFSSLNKKLKENKRKKQNCLQESNSSDNETNSKAKSLNKDNSIYKSGYDYKFSSNKQSNKHEEEEEHNKKTFIRKKEVVQNLESDFENEKSPSRPYSSQSSGEETKTKVNEKEDGKEVKYQNITESDFLSYDSRLISDEKSISTKGFIRKY